jgi:hypothetical protein
MELVLLVVGVVVFMGLTVGFTIKVLVLEGLAVMEHFQTVTTMTYPATLGECGVDKQDLPMVGVVDKLGIKAQVVVEETEITALLLMATSKVVTVSSKLLGVNENMNEIFIKTYNFIHDTQLYTATTVAEVEAIVWTA